MKLLYSNILPLGIDDTQQTIADCIKDQLAEADHIRAVCKEPSEHSEMP